jgi:uncharacterized RDD family membrane protein YckC
MTPSPTETLQEPAAGLARRLASLAYEALLITALVLVMTFPFVGMTGGKVSTGSRIALQLYVLMVCGAYFIWFWRHGGQTLPMKTWHVKVVSNQGQTLTLRVAVLRYIYAIAGTLLLGVTYFWAIFDRDRQFLHDRLAGTRVVSLT